MISLKHFFLASFVFLSVFAEKTIAAPLTDVNLRAGLISALKQHPSILGFYKENEYELIWLKNTDISRQRRAELINALKTASFHGLPAAKNIRSKSYLLDYPRVTVLLRSGFWKGYL